jgi:hypothetical protein
MSIFPMNLDLMFLMCRSSLVIAASSWLRSLFPEITALRREVPTDLQTHVEGVPVNTYTLLWISRRNYEEVLKKCAEELP